MALLVLFRFLDEVLPDEEVALHKHTAKHISPLVGSMMSSPFMYALHTCWLRKRQLWQAEQSAMTSSWQWCCRVRATTCDLLSTWSEWWARYFPLTLYIKQFCRYKTNRLTQKARDVDTVCMFDMCTGKDLIVMFNSLMPSLIVVTDLLLSSSCDLLLQLINILNQLLSAALQVQSWLSV